MKSPEVIYVNRWGQICNQIELNLNKRFKLDKSLVDMAWLDSDGVVFTPENNGVAISAFVDGRAIELEVANYLGEQTDVDLVGYTKNDVKIKVGERSNENETVILTNQLKRVYALDSSSLEGEEPGA